jgi:hypothetical protein
LLTSAIISAGVAKNVKNVSEENIMDNTFEIQEMPLIGFTKSKMRLLENIKNNIKDVEMEFIIQSMMEYIDKNGIISVGDINQIINSPQLSSIWEFFIFANVFGRAGYLGGARGFPFHISWLSIIFGVGAAFWIGPSLFVRWSARPHSNHDFTDFQIRSLGKNRHITAYHDGFALFSPLGFWTISIGGTFPHIGSVCSVGLRSPLVFIKMS